MGGEWSKIPVADICEIFLGGTPKRSEPDYWGGSIKWASAKDVSNCTTRYLTSTEDTITPKGLEESAAKLLEEYTVVITARGTVGAICMLGEPMSFNQTCYGLVGKKNIIQHYLYYALKNELSQIRSISYGTVFDTITMKSFQNLKISLPDITQQHAIVHILGTLDEKIELNRKMNETLEAIARAIFKSWFVDFDPVHAKAQGRDTGLPKEIADLFPDSFEDSELGKIPKGWEVIPFGNLLKKTIGGDWGKKNKDKKHNQKSFIIRGTDIPNLRAGSKGKIPKRWVEEKKIKKRKLIDGDIVIEISGGSPKQSTGRSIYLTNNILNRLENIVEPASFCRLFRPKNHYLGLLGAQHLNYIYNKGKMWGYQNQSTGISNFQTKLFLENELIAIPKNKQLLKLFYLQCRPLINFSQSNESYYLTKLRDILLPKLIAGDLKVPIKKMEF